MPDDTGKLGEAEEAKLLADVDAGMCSVRYAARRLGITLDELQMRVWGEVYL